uniref:Ig-like domain-containing protein n=1 Tax=Pyxicephalus adspersus TaxID=30357 RepID=A0AAV3A7F2_PYXAD|nr:TPA: hypothetical protein GDO54_013558 [Pyxicephalus adspersus]
MDTFLIFLLIFPMSALSQTLSEFGPGIVKSSQQLKMTCTVSGFGLTNYHVHWVRQFPDGKMEWLGAAWATQGIAYADSMKNRATITKDNSKKEVYLQINTMETKDSGKYYCARDTKTELN